MKDLSSLIAVILSFAITVPYLVGMRRGHIKPHAFSWLIWGLSTLIAFAGQLAAHGGIGAAATGSSSAICLGIGFYALAKGDRDFNRFDWFCFVVAALSLLAWYLTHSPLGAIILISLVDVVGGIPTIRKGHAKPYEEGISPFVLSTIKWLFAIYAFAQLNLTTLLFPIATTAVNTAIIATVLVQRSRVSKPLPASAEKEITLPLPV